MYRFAPIVVVGLLFATTPLLAEQQRTISVAGVGRISAPPDQVSIDTGVITQSVEAAVALSENNRAMQLVLKLLGDFDIESRDVQTTSFTVSPIYKRDDNKRITTEVAGYRVANQLTFRMRGTEQLGELLDALVKAGGNRIANIRFGVQDPAKLLDEARDRAIADARARAERYAEAAGVEVGAVLSIREHSVRRPAPQPGVRTAMMDQAASVPIARGEHELSVGVDVTYELED